LYENVIPWAISALSLLFIILTYVRNGNKDKLNETREEDNLMNGIREGLLKANMKLDQVCTTTNETRTDIKSLNKDLQNLDLRVAMVEKDLKNAFHQIDELNHRVSEN
jgi:septal ring factor EnvC (AmiA/AmiB activator)